MPLGGPHYIQPRSKLYPDGFFARDGSHFVLRSAAGTLVVLPTAGGAAKDFGPAIDLGTISMDGTRVAFLRSLPG